MLAIPTLSGDNMSLLCLYVGWLLYRSQKDDFASKISLFWIGTMERGVPLLLPTCKTERKTTFVLSNIVLRLTEA